MFKSLKSQQMIYVGQNKPHHQKPYSTHITPPSNYSCYTRNYNTLSALSQAFKRSK